MATRSVEELDLRGRRVFLRVDFNVPLDATGRIQDDARIRAALPTICLALERGARLIVASHLGRPKGPTPSASLRPVAARLSELVDRPVPLAPDCIGPTVSDQIRALEPGDLLMLENLRFHPEEEANDPTFAKALAALADVFVNDAFGAAHRAHASTYGIAQHLPSAAGLLMKRELEVLARLFERPERPLLAIIGGAKVSEKLKLLTHLLGRVDHLLIGGGMAFTFHLAQGYRVGRSLAEPDLVGSAREVFTQARARGVQMHLPVDCVVADQPDARVAPEVVRVDQIPADRMGLDIGPETVGRFIEVIRVAKMIVWNGPLGVFEYPAFAQGTLRVARAVAESSAFSVLGGGDTAAAVQRAEVADKIGYISSGGGAFLEYLEGRELPGVVVLEQTS